MKPLSALIVLISISLWLLGCASQPKSDWKPVITLPPDLHVPVVTVEELQCVSDETYTKLKRQAELRKARIETLKNIIKSIQQQKQK